MHPTIDHPRSSTGVQGLEGPVASMTFQGLRIVGRFHVHRAFDATAPVTRILVLRVWNKNTVSGIPALPSGSQ